MNVLSELKKDINKTNIKTTIFEVLIIMLRTQEISLLVETLLQGSELMQYLGFPFSSTFHYIWKKENAANSISRFTKYFEITIYFENSPGLYLYAFYLIALLVLLVLINLIYVYISVLRKKFSVIWPLRILRYAVSFIITILFMPIIEVFVSILDCVDKDTTDNVSLLVNAYNNNLVCWEGEHYIHVIMGIFFTILFSIISIMVQLCYFESRLNPNDDGAKANARVECFLTATKIVNILLKSFFYKYEHLHWVIIIITWTISFLMFWFYYYFRPDYNLRVQKIKLVITGIYLWTNTVLVVGKILEYSQFNSCIEVLVIGIVLIICYSSISSCEDSEYIIHDTTNLTSIHQAMLQIRNFIFLIESSKNDRQSKLRLSGIITTLSQNPNVDKHGYFKNFVDNLKDNKYKNVSFLYQHVKKLYVDSIFKFPHSVELRISYAYFLLDIVRNKNLALSQLEQAEKQKPFFDQQFTIYRCKKLIEASNIQENASLDIISSLAYKNYFNQFKNAIQQTTGLYIEFWTYLLNSKKQNEYENLEKLNELGTKINGEIEEVNLSYNKMKEIKQIDFQALKLYSEFLNKILNENDKSNELKKTLNEMESTTTRLANYLDENSDNLNLNYFNNNTTIEDYNVLIVSAETENIGQILNVTSGVCSILGYTKREILGENINKLIPNNMQNAHKQILSTKAYDFKNLMNNNIGSKVTLEMSFNHKRILACTKLKYLIPLDLDVKIFYSMEQSECTFFCKINPVKLTPNACLFLVDKDLNIQLSSANALNLVGINVKELTEKNCKIYDYILEIKNEIELHKTDTNNVLEDVENILFAYYFRPVNIIIKKPIMNTKSKNLSIKVGNIINSNPTYNSSKKTIFSSKLKDMVFDNISMSLVVSPVKFKEELKGYIFTLEKLPDNKFNINSQKKSTIKTLKPTSIFNNQQIKLKEYVKSDHDNKNDNTNTEVFTPHLFKINTKFIPKLTTQFTINLNNNSFKKIGKDLSYINTRKEFKKFAEERLSDIYSSENSSENDDNSSEADSEDSDSKLNISKESDEKSIDGIDINEGMIEDFNEFKEKKHKKSSLKIIKKLSNNLVLHDNTKSHKSPSNMRVTGNLENKYSKSTFKDRLSSKSKVNWFKEESASKMKDYKKGDVKDDKANKYSNTNTNEKLMESNTNIKEKKSDKFNIKSLLSSYNYYDSKSNYDNYYRYCYTQNKVVKIIEKPLFSYNKLENLAIGLTKIQNIAKTFLKGNQEFKNSNNKSYLGILFNKLESNNLTEKDAATKAGGNELNNNKLTGSISEPLNSTNYSVIKQIEYSLTKEEKQDSIVNLKMSALGFTFILLSLIITLLVISLKYSVASFKSLVDLNFHYDSLILGIDSIVTHLRNVDLIHRGFTISNLVSNRDFELLSLQRIDELYKQILVVDFSIENEFYSNIVLKNAPAESQYNNEYDSFPYKNLLSTGEKQTSLYRFSFILEFIQKDLYKICKNLIFNQVETDIFIENILLNIKLMPLSESIKTSLIHSKQNIMIITYILLGVTFISMVAALVTLNTFYIKSEEKKESYLEVFLEIGHNVIMKSINKCEKFNKVFSGENDYIETNTIREDEFHYLTNALSRSDKVENKDPVDTDKLITESEAKKSNKIKNSNKTENLNLDEKTKGKNEKSYGIKFILSIPLILLLSLTIIPIVVMHIKFEQTFNNIELINGIITSFSHLKRMINYLREEIILEFKAEININNSTKNEVDMNVLKLYSEELDLGMKIYHSVFEDVENLSFKKYLVLDNEFFNLFSYLYYNSTCEILNSYIENYMKVISVVGKANNYSINKNRMSFLINSSSSSSSIKDTTNLIKLLVNCQDLMGELSNVGLNTLINYIYKEIYLVMTNNYSESNKNSEVLSKKLKRLSISNELALLNTFIFGPSARNLTEAMIVKEEENFSFIKIFIIVFYSIGVILIIVLYVFIWKRFEKELEKIIYKTKNMLSIIPKEVLASLHTIQNLLNIKDKNFQFQREAY